MTLRYRWIGVLGIAALLAGCGGGGSGGGDDDAGPVAGDHAGDTGSTDDHGGSGDDSGPGNTGGNASIDPLHYFVADDGSSGVENNPNTTLIAQLWGTDGTAAGTRMVKDILPGGNPEIRDLTMAGERVFFVADAGDGNGEQVWTSDGTRVGTRMVRNIVQKDGEAPEKLTAVGTTLFFTVDVAQYNRELWKSDGTEAGTQLVRDIWLPASGGAESSNPSELTAMGGILYFSANDSNGRELWRSDGTQAGTRLVKDIFGNAGDFRGSTPRYLSVADGSLYFLAFNKDADPITVRDLWKSDGTEAGTVLVKAALNTDITGLAADLTVAGANVFFRNNRDELWVSDGSADGTRLVRDGFELNFFARNVNTLGNTLLFVQTGDTLWRSDGTTAGTVQVRRFVDAITMTADLPAVGNRIYFTAKDSEFGGSPLWRSDGTDTGTTMVEGVSAAAGGSDPEFLTAVGDGDTLFFSYRDYDNRFRTIHGRELWRTDGTAAGTGLVKDICPGSCDGFVSN